MLMCPHVRRIHRQQLLDVLDHRGVEPEYRRHLGEHRVVGAVQGPSVMPLPHRLPRSEIGWQVPPWATSAESPCDPLQYQTMVTEPVAPLALIRWHHRFDSRPKLIRNHTHSRHRPIVARQRPPIRETRPSQSGAGMRSLQRRQERCATGGVDCRPDAGARPRGAGADRIRDSLADTARPSRSRGARHLPRAACRRADVVGVQADRATGY